ncbi:MAG: T9SS type A sorting domain-containing protein [Flavobacteriales bacterium]
MKNIYKSLKDREPAKKLVRISAIIIMVAVWILIDKGNIYGQSISDRDVISKSKSESIAPSALLREGEDLRDGDELPIVDEGDLFTIKPNPVQHELVFDFEFTVKTTIPYEVLDPLGRLAFQGAFEPGVATQSLDFSRLKTGMYIVRMHLGDKLEVRRVIKK